MQNTHQFPSAYIFRAQTIPAPVEREEVRCSFLLFDVISNIKESIHLPRYTPRAPPPSPSASLRSSVTGRVGGQVLCTHVLPGQHNCRVSRRRQRAANWPNSLHLKRSGVVRCSSLGRVRRGGGGGITEAAARGEGKSLV